MSRGFLYVEGNPDTCFEQVSSLSPASGTPSIDIHTLIGGRGGGLLIGFSPDSPNPGNPPGSMVMAQKIFLRESTNRGGVQFLTTKIPFSVYLGAGS